MPPLADGRRIGIVVVVVAAVVPPPPPRGGEDDRDGVCVFPSARRRRRRSSSPPPSTSQSRYDDDDDDDDDGSASLRTARRRRDGGRRRDRGLGFDQAIVDRIDPRRSVQRRPSDAGHVHRGLEAVRRRRETEEGWRKRGGGGGGGGAGGEGSECQIVADALPGGFLVAADGRLVAGEREKREREMNIVACAMCRQDAGMEGVES